MRRKHIEFQSNGSRLVGFIDYPEKLPAPGVITFHGGSNNKDDCPCFPQVPEALVRNGYVNMRFDFFGSGESDGLFQEKTITILLQNMKDALDVFAADENVAKIGIFARSQSGLAQACLYDERIVCRVIQSTSISIKKVFEYWYPKEWKKFWADPSQEFFCIEAGDVRKVKGPYCYSRKSFEEEDEIRQRALETLPKTENVLIMHGNADVEIEPQQSWEIYNLLKRPKEFHIIDGAGHSFKGYEDRVVDLSLYWFDRFLKNK